jgi:methyl-accepting chemotaxis protein
MRIRAKIFLFIIITSSILFAGVIGFIIFRYRGFSIQEANRMASVYAQNASDNIRAALEKDLGVCETLTYSFGGIYDLNAEARDQLYTRMLVNVLRNNPQYLSVWMSWEMRFIQPGYTKNYGRKRTAAYRESGIVKISLDTPDMDGDNVAGVYYQSKISKKDMLVNPYYDLYSPDSGSDSIFQTSIAKPILIDGEFAGVVGIDITLERFQDMVKSVKPFENSYALLLANNGVIISSPNMENAGDSIVAAYPGLGMFDVSGKIKSGQKFAFNYTDSTGVSNFVAFSPIKIGNIETPWSICIVAPTTIIEEQVIKNFNLSLIIGLSGIFIFALITLFIAQNITRPLEQAISILKDLDKGIIDFSKKLKGKSRDEIGEMGRSINNLMDTLYKTADFAKKIGQGDFNVDYQALSPQDVLGNALIEMQKNLSTGQEQEEIRQLERKKQTWAQEGLSELGEVLRKSGDNFEDYLLSILSQLVKILKADQGAIFLLNSYSGQKPFLELMTAYAYEKRKSLQSRVEIGESLVGRCFQEKEIIYMTNIPEGYTFIASGLGAQSPRCLFLMPLLFEDEPFGVIELASFRQFADFEIEFLKSSGERVASSISIMQKNVQTKELLAQYQVQSDELRIREGMMQENLQELQKLQEEAVTREKETEGIIEALANIGSIVWYDTQGNITNIKDSSLKLAGLTEKDVIGKNQSEYAMEAIEDPKAFKAFWDDLRRGQPRRRLFKTETKTGYLYISELYTPIYDKSGKIEKIINIGFNITEQKLLEEEIDRLKEEIELLKARQ